jgi:hypothetical protein
VKHRRALIAFAVAVVAATTVPAVAATRPPGSVELGAAHTVGNRYVGWQVHVSTQAYFQVNVTGAAGAATPVFFIRLDAPRVGAGRAGAPIAMAGAAGVGTSLPGPVADQSGSELPVGDYAIVAAVPGGAISAGRVVLNGPPSATVTSTLAGPAFSFSDTDFGGGPAVVVPGVDERAGVHGTVHVDVTHTLFALWQRCSDATHTVTAPPAVTGWPWAGAPGVTWGPPGTWAFTLDTTTNRIDPGLGAPCVNNLVGFELSIPTSAIPQR